MKVLIVEDDSMTRKALEHRMKIDGYDVESAPDGIKGSEILKAGKIDILLTDLHMPNFSGLDLIKYVRNELRSNIPIIMVTRVGLEETVLNAFELGADDYITKPFSPDELSLRVKKAVMKNK
ncbi:MAG TPA: response regulator transcription factor [Bacteroidales bacterium]|jgi:DNA-binding response OmpR family regulator|nr:response regulator transcription factor [Bacteroidales bacterium]